MEGLYYEITEITEMGKMSSLFFSGTGRNMFYVCLAIYLYGDLAIYGAAVAKSIRDVACTFRDKTYKQKTTKETSWSAKRFDKKLSSDKPKVFESKKIHSKNQAYIIHPCITIIQFT